MMTAKKGACKAWGVGVFHCDALLKLLLALIVALIMGALTAGCASQSADGNSDANASAESAEAKAEDEASNAENGGATDSSSEKSEGESAEPDAFEQESGAASGETSGSFAINLDELDLDCTDRDKDASYDESSAVKVSLDGSSVNVKGQADGVAVDGSTVTISQEGVYVLSGSLTDGQVVVDCAKDDKAKVQLVLDGVDISNSKGPAICVNQAKKVFVTLPKGSVNTLSDGEDYELDDGSDEPYATLYSKDDLTIQGEGSLTVNGNYRHGIASKDDLVVTGGDIAVNAKEDALRGNDCVKVFDGKFDLTSGEDAVQASNDESATAGFVLVDGGSFKINAGDDGIHAETALIINDGSIEIANANEGIEGQQIYLNGGDIDVVSSDDGLNASAGSSGGATAADTTGGQPFQQDGNGEAGGRFEGEPPQFGEDNQMQPGQDRLEGQDSQMGQDMSAEGQPPEPPQGDGVGDQAQEPNQEMIDGQASELSQDASDGRGPQPDRVKPDGFKGMRGSLGEMEADENVILKISGGKLHVNSGGDGIDSNGSLEITGGEVYVDGPTSGGDGAIDYVGTATISGGTVIAIGSAGMAESFTGGTQPFAMVSVKGSAESVVKVMDAGGEVLAQMTAAKDFSTAVVSAPGLEEGSECSVVVDDQSVSITPSTQGQKPMAS